MKRRGWLQSGMALASCAALAFTPVSLDAAPLPFTVRQIGPALPIAWVRATFGGKRNDFEYLCPTIANRGTQIVKAAALHFVYYGPDGRRAGDELLGIHDELKPGFQHATILRRYGERTGDPVKSLDAFRLCLHITYPSQGIATARVFVEGVVFENGTTLTFPTLAVPESVELTPASAAEPEPTPSP